MTEPPNFILVDRVWFLTWTTYGTWLPGDERGFVGSAKDEFGEFSTHNEFGSALGKPNEHLRSAAEQQLKANPILLNIHHARALLEQFQETVHFRKWLLIAVGIMHTHLHVVVGVPGDPDPEKILGDFKAYGSRCLNQKWGKPTSDTWWTTRGSKRKLGASRALETVVHYVCHQPNPLLIWTRENGFLVGKP